MSAHLVDQFAGRDVDKKLIPLGRVGMQEDMAGTLLYLVSRAGSYCNGACLVVDGGRMGTFSVPMDLSS